MIGALPCRPEGRESKTRSRNVEGGCGCADQKLGFQKLRHEHIEKRHHTREAKPEAWQTMSSEGLRAGTVCGEQDGVGMAVKWKLV